MPPPPPAPNSLYFPDLPLAARARMTPALLQNDGNANVTLSSLSKHINKDRPLVDLGKQFDYSPNSDTSKNVIASSYDASFEDFLGEYVPPHSWLPPFDEILPPPQSAPVSVSGTLLLSC